MTALPTEPVSPSALHRVNRRAIAITVLGVIFSLIVLLQLLPGAHAAAPSVHGAASSPMLFAGWAVLTLTVIGASLVRATRRDRD